MKCRNASVIAMSAALTCAAGFARSAETVIRVPETPAARSASGLISRAERAIRRYVDACESAAARDPWDVVTRDARIEYTLDDPGAYLSLEASALFAGCAVTAASTSQPKSLWIYPTGEPDSVFIQYDMPNETAGTAPRQRLAEIEMRGERIYRMRNFGTPPETLLASMRGRAQSELCASLSRYEGSLVTNMPAQVLSSPRVWITATSSAR